MYHDNNFSCDFLEILNCHCQSLQGPLPLSKWTKEVYFAWIFRTCKWLQTHSREQKMNGKELNRGWQPKSWCNYPSCKHTWETRTHWMQEWQCCVRERERGWHCVLSALINTESRAPETACLRKRHCVVCPFLIGSCDNILVTQRPWRTSVFHALTSTDNKRITNSWIREFPQDGMNSGFLLIEHRTQSQCLCMFTFFGLFVHW